MKLTDAERESILAARLAKVEALAEEWEHGGDRLIERNQDRRSPAGQQRWVEGYAMRRAAVALRAALDADVPRRGEPVMSEQAPSAENDALLLIAERIRDEANVASRAGQYDRLNQIALDLEIAVQNRVIPSAEGCAPSECSCSCHGLMGGSHVVPCCDRSGQPLRPTPSASSAQPDEPGEGEER